MKIQMPTILTILSVILLGFLVFFNLKDTNESKYLQIQVDSLTKEINLYKHQKEILEKENDSLTKYRDWETHR